MMPDASLIEPRFREAIDRYVGDGIPPGQFLRAVLANDLLGAINRGDESALDNLPHIVDYIYTRVPFAAWGNRVAVREWISAHAK